MSDSRQGEKCTINLENPSDRWRYVCPRLHRTWEPSNHHFDCQRCSRMRDVDAAFDELVDLQSGEHLKRGEVRLVDNYGPYEKGLDDR